MYTIKNWIPTEKQREEIKSLVTHSGWQVIEDRVEYEHNELAKRLLSVIQDIEYTPPTWLDRIIGKRNLGLETLEKEGIAIETLSDFIRSIRNISKSI